ncbi:MAG TPA: hypothetical protein PLN21_16210 [Gemmatales bacterium]|nr:hypothetical protein [Gemmatales bacterium]
MIRQDLRQLRQSMGPRRFYECLNNLLETKELAPEDFSLRQLWEACVGPTAQTLPTLAARQKVYVAELDQLGEHLSEADLGINLFQTVTGAVIARRVMDAYDQTGNMIGDQLVTIERSSVRNERIAGFTALQGPREIKEGMPYEEASFGDKYVSTVESKKGRMLSITEEAVHFDQTNELLRRAARLGEATRQEREKTIVRGVTDADYSSANGTGVYRPTGALAELYKDDATLLNVLGPDNPTAGFNQPFPLDDWTSLSAPLHYHAVYVKDDRHTPETGEPLAWQPRILLVPKTLELKALQIVNATLVPANAAGSAFGGNPLRSAFTVLASPFLDQVNTAN